MYYNAMHEKIIHNNRSGTSRFFNVFLAGITNPNPEYNIPHNVSPGTRWDNYLFEYVESGLGHIEADDKVYTVGAGDFIFMNRSRRHIYYADKTDPFRKMFVAASGTLLDSLVSAYGIDGTVVVSRAPVRDVFCELMKVLGEGGGGLHDIYDRTALLLHSLIQRLGDGYRPEYADTRGDMAQAVRLYIDNGLLSRMTTPGGVAEYFSLSHSQLIRLFRRSFGKTPGRYITERKIETAVYLMARTGLSLSEISDRLYFTDEKHFSNTFRRITGKSPREYRKSLK